MSADNFIGVLRDKTDPLWKVSEGSMSVLDEDCQYQGSIVSEHPIASTSMNPKRC